MKNYFFIIMIAFFILFLMMTKRTGEVQNAEAVPRVALSTFSLYDITKNIAGDTLEAFMILPFGVDAHSYEPTPKQILKLHKSSLVVYSGAGLEPWIKGFEFKNRVIDMSRHVELKELGGHSHEHDHGHDEADNNLDPHYWLDIQNMIKATQKISKELIEMFPSNRELYVKNTQNYIDMLNKLDREYKERLSSCKLNTIVVNHNAFSYLSNRYGFEVEALSGLSPDAEPSAKAMSNLIEHVKEHKLKSIFFESFVSDKAIRSIANEAKVDVDVLQPLGNITADEAKEKLGFEDIMRSNLAKISKAMECR